MRKTFIRRCINLNLCSVTLFLFMLLQTLAINAAPMADQVTGMVKSTNQEPLIGVSVMVKGTSRGTVTDMDGKYVINASNGETLVFSYIGYVKQELIVKGKVLNATMKEDSEILNEVVVIGYGVQKKKLNTGATAQVKGETLSKLNTTSPLQA